MAAGLIPPAQAQKAGYGNLAFADDFDDLSTIDMGNSQAGDFKWYLAQWFHHGQTALDPADLSVADSVLTIAADSWNLVSAFDTHPQVPDNFHGNVFGGGGYFEVRLRYDHAAAGVTSFYAMSIEHIADASVHNNNANVGLGHWPGQPEHYGHWIEVDIFETLYDWNHGYQAHAHDWSGILYDQIIDIRNNDNYYTPVDLSDPEQFHTYGALWVPQNGTAPGRIQFYCDDVLMSSLYYLGPVGDPPLPGADDSNWTPDTPEAADRTYSIIDRHRLALCLQPSANTPLHVDWVRVWNLTEQGSSMIIDFIKIDMSTTTATQAALLKSYITTLRQAYELGGRVKGIMAHNHDGTNFVGIEQLFGLPTGKGQIVFDLVNGSVGSMEGNFQVNDAVEITERVG